MQLLPRLTAVSGSVNGSLLGLDEDHFVSAATPHDVDQRRVDLENLEVHLVNVSGLRADSDWRGQEQHRSERCKTLLTPSKVAALLATL